MYSTSSFHEFFSVTLILFIGGISFLYFFDHFFSDLSFNILLYLDEDCFQNVSSVNTL